MTQIGDIVRFRHIQFDFRYHTGYGKVTDFNGQLFYTIESLDPIHSSLGFQLTQFDCLASQIEELSPEELKKVKELYEIKALASC